MKNSEIAIAQRVHVVGCNLCIGNSDRDLQQQNELIIYEMFQKNQTKCVD